MRTSLACVLLSSSLVACGSSGNGPIGDDDVPADSNPDLPPPPDRGFRVVSPDITIEPGQEITYCYYFRTPNTEKLAIKQWKSDMTPGSHHMIMYTTQSDAQPVGTVSSQDCGLGTGGSLNIPAWTYSAQTPTAEISFPTDDGAGKPLAQEIAPNTPAFFQMHYLNATDQPIQAHVTLDAYALEASASYTQTSPFITFAGDLSIPPGATNFVEARGATPAAGTKFWMMSTHSHKQSVKTRVLDGTTEVFTSTDWEHPGASTFMTPTEFYTFQTGKLTYECTYDNTGSNANRTVKTGDSAEFDEMCMASGYAFPAATARFCYGTKGNANGTCFSL